MKARTVGFLAEDKINHDGEIFDYIQELHDYLWVVVRLAYPGASGSLRELLDGALSKLKKELEV